MSSSLVRLLLRTISIEGILADMATVIQGRADVADGKTSEDDVTKAVDFSYHAVQGKPPQGPKVDNSQSGNGAENGKHVQQGEDATTRAFTNEEPKFISIVKNVFTDYFTVNSHGGMVARMEHGNLGLRSLAPESKLTNGHAELRQANGTKDSRIPVPVAASG